MKLTVLLLLLPIFSLCQDTVRISEVTVSERSDPFIKDLNVSAFDSLTLKQYSSRTLADLLREQTPVFIKSYGNGALSTISLRGTSSVHTALIWNGIPINLSSTGDIDLSNNSVGFFDRITLIHGANSSLYGSGSVGGSLLLQDEPHFNSGFGADLSAKAGSFSNYSSSITLRQGSNKLSTKLSIYGLDHQNNFSYENPSTGERLPMKFAKHTGKGLNAGIHYRLKNSILSFHSWTEDHQRNIPAGLFGSSPYAADQKDFNSRNLLQYSFFKKSTKVSAKLAYLYDRLKYTDTITDVLSQGSQQTVFPEISMQTAISKNTKLVTGINSFLISASNNYYSSGRSRVQFASFAGVNHFIEKIQTEINLNTRLDLISEVDEAFTYNATIGKQLNKYFRASFSTGKSFRAPSLNDLYWVPGGNPGLVPEKGYNNELTIKYENIHNRNINSAGATVYSGKTDNWIIWLPATSTIWTPRNIQKVWSRGIELYYSARRVIGKTIISGRGSYSYTEASSETAADQNIPLHSQIIYVPYYNANASLTLEHGSFSIQYNQVFTGGRYTASDHSAALPWFTIGNFQLSYKAVIRKSSFSLIAGANNIWDISYQYILNRPMPGRSFEAGINFKFN